MPGTGNFEVLESDSVKANGRIIVVDKSDTSSVSGVPEGSEQTGIQQDIKTPDIYKEFRLRGYDYGPSFQGIIGANIESKYKIDPRIGCSGQMNERQSDRSKLKQKHCYIGKDLFTVNCKILRKKLPLMHSQTRKLKYIYIHNVCKWYHFHV